ncbi:hypothetical protein DET61_104317 [Marinobacter nauticus]|uniref:Uncharacterized protein n=1 Tax=Marinobacter nauticus TaxID=2743 RepID=A0A368XUH9_MARNT|nr:hypothetical protein DET61_104317 [Marinobacter nauticus]
MLKFLYLQVNAGFQFDQVWSLYSVNRGENP